MTKDLICKFLGILVLSSKFDMSIEQMYASKALNLKAFMPQYKYRRLLQYLSWPGYTYTKQSGIKAQGKNKDTGRKKKIWYINNIYIF